jgi:hypothetical protein
MVHGNIRDRQCRVMGNARKNVLPIRDYPGRRSMLVIDLMSDYITSLSLPISSFLFPYFQTAMLTASAPELPSTTNPIPKLLQSHQSQIFIPPVSYFSLFLRLLPSPGLLPTSFQAPMYHKITTAVQIRIFSHTSSAYLGVLSTS